MDLIHNGVPVCILMDSSYKDGRGYGQLLRAVQDLRQDFAMVCGAFDGSKILVKDSLIDKVYFSPN